MARRVACCTVGLLASSQAFIPSPSFPPAATVPSLPTHVGLGACVRRGGAVMMSSFDAPTKRGDSLLDQAAKLRAEALKLEEELAKTRPQAVVEVAKPPPPMTFEEARELASKMLSDSPVMDYGLKKLKENNKITKYNSLGDSMEVRRYSGEYFKKETGMTPKELESGLDTEDFKKGVAAIFAVSTFVVFVGLKIGTLISTVIAYIFLTLPIIFISIGSVSPGLLTAIIVAADSALDGKALDRRAAQEAGRFLVGYLLGLPMESFVTSDKISLVKFYDTRDGNFDQLVQQNPRKKFQKKDIVSHAVLSITGSVAERIQFGNVINRPEDFVQLGRLMDLVKPMMDLGPRNELVLFAALQAYRLLKENDAKFEKLTQLVKEKAPAADLIAVMEAKL